MLIPLALLLRSWDIVSCPQMWRALLNSVTHTYYVLGTVLGGGDITVNRIDLVPAMAEVIFQDGLG